MASSEHTFAFVDLAGFAALTEAHGDETAVELVSRFVDCARAELRSEERVVKSIGDAVMLTAPEPVAGLDLVQRICSAAGAQAGFPVLRAGLHHGPAIEREGDWFGATVNLAARVAAQAAGGQTLCTSSIADAAAGVFEFQSLGLRRLRHLAEPVELFELVSAARRDERLIDPVCHMVVSRDAGSAHLEHEGRDYWFCSLTCLATFLARTGNAGTAR